ncbi:MAG: DUF493 domain-containing protein [Gammaproteobacteria bacterium]|jgi:putative lipoic acid-binding regulatory protein|nr:DUF493 domain-containing protein [Gammaproteobacteria bacterium]MCH1549845.1 DUF493 domain-containing protein [Pseudomonadales bacterium]
MEAPRIEFPCPYPIKIVTESQASIAEIVAVVRQHAPEVTPDQIAIRESRKGNFRSIRVTIVATGESQLKRLHLALMAVNGVRLVL